MDCRVCSIAEQGATRSITLLDQLLREATPQQEKNEPLALNNPDYDDEGERIAKIEILGGTKS